MLVFRDLHESLDSGADKLTFDPRRYSMPTGPFNPVILTVREAFKGQLRCSIILVNLPTICHLQLHLLPTLCQLIIKLLADLAGFGDGVQLTRLQSAWWMNPECPRRNRSLPHAQQSAAIKLTDTPRSFSVCSVKACIFLISMPATAILN